MRVACCASPIENMTESPIESPLGSHTRGALVRAGALLREPHREQYRLREPYKESHREPYREPYREPHREPRAGALLRQPYREPYREP